jgi:putative membrane protein
MGEPFWDKDWLFRGELLLRWGVTPLVAIALSLSSLSEGQVMKKLFVSLLISAFVVGCARHKDSAGRPDSGSTTLTGSGAQSVAATDANFATEACQAGVTQVEIGKLASRNTKNQAVRALAKKLEEDHAGAEKELGELFARKGIPPQKQLEPQFQNSLERLAPLRGGEFDRAFKQQVLEDHRKAIALFQQQAEQGTDADLKAFAQARLPHLREHLALAENLPISAETRGEPTPGSPASIPVAPVTRGIHLSR